MKVPKRLLSGALTLLVLWSPAYAVSAPVRDTPPAPSAYRPVAGAGNIPMFFEENVGQTDDSVRFVGRGRDYSVLITDSEAVFKLAPSGPDEPGADVRMQWVGAGEAHIVPGDPLPGKSNYLVGNDPTAWKTNIPTFGKVRHEGVYPGVDLEFYGKGELLEYDIVVRPGADPDSVKLRFAGSEPVRIDENSGDLVLTVSGGELRHQKAVVYQPTVAGKRPVEARFRVLPGGDVGFELGEFDASEPLIIDPVVTFVSFIGGCVSPDDLAEICSDPTGAVYVAGTTQSADFAPIVAPLDGTQNGSSDAFVTKLDPVTGAVAYSTFIGSPGQDEVTGIDIDDQGSAYITGFTGSTAFPTTPGAYREVKAGDSDGFVCKLSPNGGSLVYSTYMGGAGTDLPYGIAVDGAGHAVVVGQTTSADLETLPGAYDRTIGGDGDAFAVKLSASGSALVQATYLGGNAGERADAVDITSAGDIVVAGWTVSNDFPTTAGAFDQIREGLFDEGFVTRFNPALSTTVFSTFLGHSGEDSVGGVAVDFADRVTIAGFTSSASFPITPGAPQTTFGGSSDGFVARLSATGSSLEFSTFLGSSGAESCVAIRTDASGALVVTGSTTSPDFPTTSGAFDRVLGGPKDAFVAKYSVLGTLGFSTLVGGDAADSSAGIALTPSGRVAIGGRTESWNFPTTISLTGRPTDGQDCFVTELEPGGSAITFSTTIGGIRGPGGSTFDSAAAVVCLEDRTVGLVGSTTSVNFPTVPGGFETVRSDSPNAFVVRVAADGRTLLSSTVFGGFGSDEARDIAATSTGELIIVGLTASSDFPTTAGAFDTTIGSPFSSDAFVLRLSADGSALSFATFLGGSSTDSAFAVATDADDAIYVAGMTESPGFPVTPGAFDSTFDGPSAETFVAKLNLTGSSLLYSTLLGGSSSERPYDIAVDGEGSAAVVGQTSSLNFPFTPGAYQTVNQGSPDVFVTKLGATGATAIFSTYLGALGGEQPGGVAIDMAGNIVVSGATNSSGFPTTVGAFDQTFNGGSVDGFVFALNPTGTQLVFSTFVGGNGVDILFGVGQDSTGLVWACGSSGSTDLSFPPNAFDTSNAGESDALLIALDPLGSTLKYATLLGDSGSDLFYDLAIGTGDDVVVAGESRSVLLPFPGVGHVDASSVLFARFAKAADTPALYVPPSGAWFLRYVNSSGLADSAFSYGAGGSGLVPLAGNWDGAGGDSPGLYDPSTGAFLLRNSSSPGPADVVFTFGPGGADFVPLAGDWNGDGTDTIGIYSQSTGAFFLRNANAGGPADLVFSFGPGGTGFAPLAGDWNGDGTESIGIYQIATGAFFLRNANSNGNADLVFTFGSGGSGFVPLTGDWNGDGTDTIGIRLQSSGVFFLRDSNASGPADYTFGYGSGGETPVVGNWAG